MPSRGYDVAGWVVHLDDAPASRQEIDRMTRPEDDPLRTKHQARGTTVSNWEGLNGRGGAAGG